MEYFRVTFPYAYQFSLARTDQSLEEEKLIEKIKKGVKIEIKKYNHFYEGSDPYNEVEEFFSEELLKYDSYIMENIVKILSNASCDREGFVRLPILDRTRQLHWFGGSWRDPMNPEDGFVIRLSGGQTGWGIAAEWIINFTPELSAEIQQFGPQFAILGGQLVEE